MPPRSTKLFQIFQQLKPMPDTNEIIQSYCNQKQCYLKNCQLYPIKILDESINVLACEMESDPLDETEGNSP